MINAQAAVACCLNLANSFRRRAADGLPITIEADSKRILAEILLFSLDQRAALHNDRLTTTIINRFAMEPGDGRILQTEAEGVAETLERTAALLVALAQASTTPDGCLGSA